MTEKQEAKMFKEYARAALLCEYGFGPDLNKIVLLETYYAGGPQAVLFRIGNHEYSYDGISFQKIS